MRVSTTNRFSNNGFDGELKVTTDDIYGNSCKIKIVKKMPPLAYRYTEAETISFNINELDDLIEMINSIKEKLDERQLEV